MVDKNKFQKGGTAGPHYAVYSTTEKSWTEPPILLVIILNPKTGEDIECKLTVEDAEAIAGLLTNAVETVKAG